MHNTFIVAAILFYLSSSGAIINDNHNDLHIQEKQLPYSYGVIFAV